MAEPRSMLGQSTRFTWALRSGAHSAASLAAFGRTGRRRWLVLGAAALASDPLIARALADPRRPRPAARLAADVVDVLVWLRSGDLRTAYLAGVTPAALEAGYRFGAGVDAVPVPDGARPYPPPRRHRGRAVVEAALPLVLPTGAARSWMRRSGRRAGPEELWGVMSSLSGFALARVRHRLQREARADWLARSRHQVALEAQVAEIRAATANSTGHSFKKVLLTLGYWGSTAAAEAAAEQMERPRVVAGAAGGMTLFDAALGVPIEPPHAGATWLTNAQVVRLRDFVDEAEDGPRADPGPMVVTADWTTVAVRYLGHTLRLDHPSPRVESSLDPLPAMLGYGALLKLLAITPALGGVPVPVAAVSAGCDMVAARRHWRERRRDEEAAGRALLPVAAGAAIFDLALAVGLGRGRRPGPPDRDVLPATHGTIALVLFLGHYWGALGRRRWPMAGVAAGLWLAASVTWPGRRWSRLVADAAAAGWSVVAGSGLGERIHAEAAGLERTLEAGFAQDVQNARRRAVEHELTRYTAQVDLAERELAALGHAVPADIAAVLAAECSRMRSWLSDPATRASLGSWS